MRIAREALRGGPARRRVATLAVLAAVAAGAVIAAPPASADVVSGSAAGVSYAAQRHLTVGIAVVDTWTGASYTAGASTRKYVTASVVKALIATRLLLEHEMSGHNATLAHVMIVASDNDAAQALYPKVGGDTLLPWLAKHYGISDLGTAPTQPGAWGTTQVTAGGLARLYAAIRIDHTVWPWLSKAMHGHEARSSAGEPNNFGIAAAAPASAVKNGWLLLHSGGTSSAVINTTGFVDGDRYAVVILGSGPASLYYRTGEAISSHVAGLVMPGGHITPVAPPRIGWLSTSAGRLTHSPRIAVHGAGFTGVTGVLFGTVRAGGVQVASSGLIYAIPPDHTAGTVPIRVVGRYGTSAPIAYLYVAAPTLTAVSQSNVPSAGGVKVLLTGTDLRDVRAVSVGGAAATFAPAANKRVVITTPPHAAGSAPIVITTAYGASVPFAFAYTG